MSRMVVIKNKDGSVSCLPVSKNKDYYYEKYDVVVFVNKLWNYYHVKIIKDYFHQKYSEN